MSSFLYGTFTCLQLGLGLPGIRNILKNTSTLCDVSHPQSKIHFTVDPLSTAKLRSFKITGIS